MRKKTLTPIHPGEVLLLDFLEPMGISQYRLAKGIRVPPRRINEIVQRDRLGASLERDVEVLARAG